MWLIFPGHPSKNGKKPVFVAVDILFSYLDKFFHDFRNFIQTLVNILRNVTHSDHYFPIWDGR
jgi:hypothetical protein